MITTRPVHKATEIKLKRQSHMGTFLVVEGRDDRLFMERFTCAKQCKIEIAQGKDNVCAVIEILDAEAFSGALGLVDADFDRIEAPEKSEYNVRRPEYHDLETMLLCSPALDRVLVELGSQRKLTTFEGKVLDALISRALPLGCLRLYSLRSGLNLKFDGLSYSAWIDRNSFMGCTKQMIEEVKNRSQRPDLSTNLVEEAILDIKNAGYDPLELCNGTDLISILAIGLRGRLGNLRSSEVNASSLRQYLRLAYSEQDFCKSDLGKSIHSWEMQAGGFQVLRTQLVIAPS